MFLKWLEIRYCDKVKINLYFLYTRVAAFSFRDIFSLFNCFVREDIEVLKTIAPRLNSYILKPEIVNLSIFFVKFNFFSLVNVHNKFDMV